MPDADVETLGSVSRRLEVLVDARLQGQLSAADQDEYQRLITLESALLKLRNSGSRLPAADT
jgi:hypothetical protein